MRIDAPWMERAETREVMAALTKEGARAYFVGGCVRNTIVGAEVSDVDIATDALPEAVIARAEDAGLRALPTGIDHGTVTLIAYGVPFEVTTFRKDIETDGRRAVVAFSDRIEDDARRRDFTMNALYADANGVLVDPLGGLDDLLSGHVRFIEDAAERIAEDYLRILRFFRFHAWFGSAEKGLDPDGLAACAAGVAGIARLSRERIGIEIRKLLSAPEPRQSLRGMDETGVLEATLPGADAALADKVIRLEVAQHVAADWRRRLSALGGAAPAKLLRLSRRDATHLTQLEKALSGDMSLPELAYRFGADVAQSAAFLRAARTGGSPPVDWQSQIDHGRKARFPVVASDLMHRHSGKALGDCLKALEDKWIRSNFKLDKESLLNEL